MHVKPGIILNNQQVVGVITIIIFGQPLYFSALGGLSPHSLTQKSPFNINDCRLKLVKW